MPFAIIRFEKQFNHAWEIEKYKIWDARLAQKTRRDPDARVTPTLVTPTLPTLKRQDVTPMLLHRKILCVADETWRYDSVG